MSLLIKALKQAERRHRDAFAAEAGERTDATDPDAATAPGFAAAHEVAHERAAAPALRAPIGSPDDAAPRGAADSGFDAGGTPASGDPEVSSSSPAEPAAALALVADPLAAHVADDPGLAPRAAAGDPIEASGPQRSDGPDPSRRGLDYGLGLLPARRAAPPMAGATAPGGAAQPPSGFGEPHRASAASAGAVPLATAEPVGLDARRSTEASARSLRKPRRGVAIVAGVCAAVVTAVIAWYAVGPSGGAAVSADGGRPPPLPEAAGASAAPIAADPPSAKASPAPVAPAGPAVAPPAPAPVVAASAVRDPLERAAPAESRVGPSRATEARPAPPRPGAAPVPVEAPAATRTPTGERADDVPRRDTSLAAPAAPAAPAATPPRREPAGAAARAATGRAEPAAATPQLTPSVVPSEQVARLLEQAWRSATAGRRSDARRVYEQALALDRNNVDALAGLAHLAGQDGDTAGAERAWRRVLEIDPNDPVARAGLVALLGQSDASGQESQLRGLIARDPADPAPHFALGNALAAQGRWAEAQQAFFSAVSGDPDQPDYLFNLAVSLERIRQPQAALPLYRRALQAAATRAARFDPAAANARIATIEAGRVAARAVVADAPPAAAPEGPR